MRGIGRGRSLEGPNAKLCWEMAAELGTLKPLKRGNKGGRLVGQDAKCIRSRKTLGRNADRLANSGNRCD